MSKAWENIILSWQQALIVGGFILTLGKGINDISVLKKDLEYLKGRIDRRVDPVEEDLKKLEDRVNKVEKCNE